MGEEVDNEIEDALDALKNEVFFLKQLVSDLERAESDIEIRIIHSRLEAWERGEFPGTSGGSWAKIRLGDWLSERSDGDD